MLSIEHLTDFNTTSDIIDSSRDYLSIGHTNETSLQDNSSGTFLSHKVIHTRVCPEIGNGKHLIPSSHLILEVHFLPSHSFFRKHSVRSKITLLLHDVFQVNVL